MKAFGLVGVFCVTVVTTATPSHASTFIFNFETQPLGVMVSGGFTATDISQDGRITETEVTSWDIAFDPGSSGLVAFNLGSQSGDDLFNFSYVLDSGTMGIFEAVGLAGQPQVSWVSPTLTIIDAFGDDYIASPIDIPEVVKVVPLPPALWMLGSALLGVAGVKRKHRR